MSSDDYIKRGDLPTSKWSGRVTLRVDSAMAVPLDVVITYPSSGAAAYPVLVMYNGFQAKAPWYRGIVDHVSSWGYTVVQYTNGGLFPIVVDRVELTYLEPLLTWLETQSADAKSPLYGRADVSRLGTMGHSRGGKLAALQFAGRTDVSGCVLFDPVDGSPMTPESADYPSATKALAAAGRSAGLVGAAITGSCNPVGQNYPKFWGALAPGSWQMVLSQAGHMQFARTGNPFLDWSLDRLCGRGTMMSSDVITYSAAFTVAWFEGIFRPAQSQMGISNFKTWANTQVAARSITFDIKPMQSPQ
ncbi:hypothetical protein CHLRE_03g148750v5 [Chlamydomonas reinhardtii]|uniref:Chlorophyllase n=1 Tax=Chlamydomonas reinhardtii TaxID=3055 RepID=A0A2K3DVK9_CHLRE|nr:uncharacterized protein CHLRE_03g148750v5 [Chlamydomonas reinhardtii]PNW84556.1 hypothetical protein CHLRE_03g148750v5 [Chlamydomonas reinhardtii]